MPVDRGFSIGVCMDLIFWIKFPVTKTGAEWSRLWIIAGLAIPRAITL